MSADTARTIEADGAAEVRPLFGLDAAETGLLKQLFGELAAPMGLDGGRIIEGLGRGDSLAKVLALPPQMTELLYGRAHSWFTAGSLDRAERLFRALCILDSAVADYWVGYGICLGGRAARAEARLAFATAAALRPDWAVPHFHAAQLALAEARWQFAADHLAAFEARADADLPAAMRREAARQQQALRLRRDRQNAKGGAP